MPKIVEALPLNIGERRYCVLFLDEWPHGPANSKRGKIDDEEFELHIVFLDGGGRIHNEPRVGIEISGRDIDPHWFADKELQLI